MSDTFAQHSVEIARLNRAIEIERKAGEQIAKARKFREAVVKLAFPIGTLVRIRDDGKGTSFVVVGHRGDDVIGYPANGHDTKYLSWSLIQREQDARAQAGKE